MLGKVEFCWLSLLDYLADLFLKSNFCQCYPFIYFLFVSSSLHPLLINVDLKSLHFDWKLANNYFIFHTSVYGIVTFSDSEYSNIQ